MPRKKTIPTEPQPDPPAGITEATVELAPDSIEQPSPDILDGSTPPGEDLETPAVPSETDAEAGVVPTEASEDAEEPSADDADMTVDFVEHHRRTLRPIRNPPQKSKKLLWKKTPRRLRLKLLPQRSRKRLRRSRR